MNHRLLIRKTPHSMSHTCHYRCAPQFVIVHCHLKFNDRDKCSCNSVWLTISPGIDNANDNKTQTIQLVTFVIHNYSFCVIDKRYNNSSINNSHNHNEKLIEIWHVKYKYYNYVVSFFVIIIIVSVVSRNRISIMMSISLLDTHPSLFMIDLQPDLPLNALNAYKSPIA